VDSASSQGTLEWVPQQMTSVGTSTAAQASRNQEVNELDVDAAAMRAIAAGDERALAALIDRWQAPLIRFFQRSLSNRADAEDLAQVVFVRLNKAAPRYRADAKFSTYLFSIARRLLLNELRRRRRKPAEPLDVEEFQMAESDAGAARARREAEEVFHRALRELPEKHRTAILLLIQQELSYTEIARTMKASESAVKTWIFRARQQLRAELARFQ
jgi:RNA polymerase sigma-70 factor (ECF subfamily)